MQVRAQAMTRLAEGAPMATRPQPAAPAGMYVPGRPWRIMSTGQVRSRFSGDALLREVTAADLSEAERYFAESQGDATVPIDWDHDDEQAHFGRVVDMYVHDEGDGRGPGLYAVPALTPAGVQRLAEYNGDSDSYLYTSPEIVLGPVYAKRGDRPRLIANAAVTRLALTPWPKQAIDSISAAHLSEAAQTAPQGAEGNTMEELQAKLDEALATIEALAAENEALKAEAKGKAEEGEQASEAAAQAAEKLAASETERQALSERAEKLDGERAKLAERVEKLEAHNRAVEKKAAVDHLVLSERILPKERARAEQAYDLREQAPLLWGEYSERKAGHVKMDTDQLSHGGDPELLDDHQRATKQRAAAEKLMSEKGITYAAALSEVKKKDQASA